MPTTPQIAMAHPEVMHSSYDAESLPNILFGQGQISVPTLLERLSRCPLLRQSVSEPRGIKHGTKIIPLNLSWNLTSISSLAPALLI